MAFEIIFRPRAKAVDGFQPVLDRIFKKCRINHDNGCWEWEGATGFKGYGRVRVVLTASMLAAAPAPRFVVRGSAGTLTRLGWDPQEEHLLRGLRPGAPGWGQDSDPLVIHRGDRSEVHELRAPAGDYPAYYAAARDAIVRGTAPPVTAHEACTVMAVLEAADRSAAEGRVVAPDFTAAERRAWAPQFESKIRGATPSADR